MALALGAAPAKAQVPDFERYRKGDCAFAKTKDPENCISCHHKEKEQTIQKITGDEESHDVIIVGAGIAGLSTAWKLRDVDAVVLEKDSRTGGKMLSHS